jgi:hypothetical protein
VVILGGWNLKHEVLPASNSDNNADLQRALWVARETPENAWIVVDGTDQVYVPYFAHRRTLNLRYYQDREPELFQRIASLKKKGEPVFVVPQTLPEPWRKNLARSSTLQARSVGLELRRMAPKPN